MKVGFIGLGTMGAPMARNVQKKGHALVVFDVNRASVDALVASGATAAASPREVATRPTSSARRSATTASCTASGRARSTST